MKIKYTGDKPQFLGMIKDKPFVIFKKTKSINLDEWDAVKDRPWTKHLIDKNLLEVEKKDKEKEIDWDKEIEQENVEITEEVDSGN